MTRRSTCSFRMDREKLVGEKFREGRMEVAFELWIEKVYFYSFSRLQRRFPPLSGEAISELKIDSRIVLSAEVFLNLGGTTDMYVRPGRLAQGAFFVCVGKSLYSGGICNGKKV